MKNNIVVLFHEIKDMEWFETVMCFLKSQYTLISADELGKAIIHQKKINGLCHITFDDGHISFYEKAFPVICQYKAPVTLFISPKIVRDKQNYWFQMIRELPKNEFMAFICNELQTNFKTDISNFNMYSILKTMPIHEITGLVNDFTLGSNQPKHEYINLNENQLTDVLKSGFVQIGAHTLSHPILYNETDDIVKHEIEDSISDLADLIGQDIRYFAYPNGLPKMDFSQREQNLLKERNISLAFSTEMDCLKKNSNPFAIPRIGVTKGSIDSIKFKLLFARQWKIVRNIMLSKNEEHERKLLIKHRRINAT